MIESILNGILNALASVVNFLLTPLNLLFANLFPDISTAINNFNTFVTDYINSGISYFLYLLPPMFRGLLLAWLTFIVSYYLIYYTYIGLIKLFTIIQKVKFW